MCLQRADPLLKSCYLNTFNDMQYIESNKYLTDILLQCYKTWVHYCKPLLPSCAHYITHLHANEEASSPSAVLTVEV